MTAYDDCIAQGLLRRMAPSKRQALDSLSKADALLKETGAIIDKPNSAMLSAYAAIFNAARAVLFKDGYQEKSHACVARYLERTHPEIETQYIQLLDQYRTKRHRVQYSYDYFPTDQEAKAFFEFAERFVARMRKVVETP